MQKQDHPKECAFNVDLIRAIAIVGVIWLHAAGRWTTTPQQITQMSPLETVTLSTVAFYQSLGCIAVPLFIMLHGALLLQPGKNESIRTFFKKRWNRIGLPFVIWSVVYFVWDFTVANFPFTVNVVIHGILNGPYSQFWYYYMLVGLYLMTPILRIFLAHADRPTTTYFVLVWLLGVTIVPLVKALTPFTVGANIFTIGEFVGYFVLGTYLLTLKISRKICATLMVLGFVLTAALTYLLAATIGGEQMYLFQEYFSPTIILASTMAFLLLLPIKPYSDQNQNQNQKEHTPSAVRKLVRVISANIVPLFFIHVIILEAIRKGFFGFTISRYVINPIIDIPLETVVTLFISLGIILLLKKIPHMKKIIG